MAENIIGLLFEIAADPKKAQLAMAELKASTVAESTEISSLWSQAMNVMTGPTGIVAGLVVGLGTAMFELAEHAADVGSRIYDLSQKTGIAAEKLSGMRVLAKENNESFDELSLVMGRASVNIERALVTGTGQANSILHQLYKTTKEYNEFAALPMDQQFQSLLHRVFALNTAQERNLGLQTFLGRAWQANRISLKQLAEEGFDPAIQKSKDLHQFYDAERTAEMKQFQRAWDDLKQTYTGLADEIGSALVPAFLKLMDFGAHDTYIGMLRTENAQYAEHIRGMKALGDASAEEIAAFQNLIDANNAFIQKQNDAAAAQGKAKKATEGHSDSLKVNTHEHHHAAKAVKEHAAELTPLQAAVERIKQQRFDAAINAQAAALTALHPKIQLITKDWSDLARVAPLANLPLQDMTDLVWQLAPALDVASDATTRFARVNALLATVTASANAQMLESEIAAITGIIAGRRAQAAVEGVWESAKAFSAFAHYDFWSGTQHSLAAAEYFIVAGGGGGGGKGAYGSGVGQGTVRGPSSGAGPQPGVTSGHGIGNTSHSGGGPPSGGDAFAGAFSNARGLGSITIIAEPAAGQYLAKILNTHVQHDGFLLSSHVKDAAPTVLSR